jgi:hypothetical protein
MKKTSYSGKTPRRFWKKRCTLPVVLSLENKKDSPRRSRSFATGKKGVRTTTPCFPRRARLAKAIRHFLYYGEFYCAP